MGDNSSSGGGGGCGCVSIIVLILVLWALWFGLPINDKKWNIDIFPPRIWDMNDKVNQPTAEDAEAEVPAEKGDGFSE